MEEVGRIVVAAINNLPEDLKSGMTLTEYNGWIIDIIKEVSNAVFEAKPKGHASSSRGMR